MKKVVVERPRWGSRARNEKFGARLRYIEGHDYEEQPKKALGFESYHDGWGKRLTDFLTPLKRFLRSNLRRPWDEVYSELCTGLDKRKATGLHIFQHLESMVERNCYLDDNGGARCVRYGDQEVIGFYVHPRTGLLLEAPRKSNRQRARRRLEAEPVNRVLLNNNSAYQKHEGIWYRVRLRRFVVSTYKSETEFFDIFLKRNVKLSFGETWLAVEKKQCNRKELKDIRRRLEERERKLRPM
jgi:hypothetical protein